MALVYSRSFLKSISSSILTRCSLDLWRCLTDHGISRVQPTRRGCHGGQCKRIGINHRLSQDQQPDLSSLCRLKPSNLSTCIFNISTRSTENLKGEALLHNTSRESLNNQSNTSVSIPAGSREKFMGQQQSNN